MMGMCAGMLLICVLCLILSITAYAKVIGFENSTHKIEYMDPNAGQDTDDMDEEQEFDPWMNGPGKDSQADAEKAEAARLKYEREAETTLAGSFEG